MNLIYLQMIGGKKIPILMMLLTVELVEIFFYYNVTKREEKK